MFRLSTRKRYIIYYAVIISIFMIVGLSFAFPSVFQANINNTDILEDSPSFWIKIILITLLFSMISYFFMFKIKIFNSYEKTDTYIISKNVSNDVFFVIFIIGYFIFNLPNSTSIIDENNFITSTFLFYQRYEVLALMSIPLLKFYNYISSKRKLEKNPSLFNLGNFSIYLKIFMVSLGSFAFILLFSSIIKDISGIITKDGRNFIMLMLCATIPFEELVFRGIGYLIFTEVFSEIIYDFKGIPRDKRNNYSIYRKYGEFISIVFTSFLFGIYHLNAYGYSVFTISYLIALGFFMGISNYYLGLLTAFCIHSINNVYANLGANIIGNLQNKLYFQIFIPILFILLILIYYIKNREKGGHKK